MQRSLTITDNLWLEVPYEQTALPIKENFSPLGESLQKNRTHHLNLVKFFILFYFCDLLFLYQPTSTGGQQAGLSPGDAFSFSQLLDIWDGARRLWLHLGMATSCCLEGSDRRGSGAVTTVWWPGCSPAAPGAGTFSLHLAGALHWNPSAVKIPFLPLWRKVFSWDSVSSLLLFLPVLCIDAALSSLLYRSDNCPVDKEMFCSPGSKSEPEWRGSWSFPRIAKLLDFAIANSSKFILHTL